MNTTYLKRKSKNLCVRCGKNPPIIGTTYCEVCKEGRKKWRKPYIKRTSLSQKQLSLARERDRRMRARLWEFKTQVIYHYGGKCACCGESQVEFLTIDHINGGGEVERKRLGKTGARYYQWIISNNFPSNLQLLCWNCNCARQLYGGICPHKKGGIYYA